MLEIIAIFSVFMFLAFCAISLMFDLGRLTFGWKPSFRKLKKRTEISFHPGIKNPWACYVTIYQGRNDTLFWDSGHFSSFEKAKEWVENYPAEIREWCEFVEANTINKVEVYKGEK